MLEMSPSPPSPSPHTRTHAHAHTHAHIHVHMRTNIQPQTHSCKTWGLVVGRLRIARMRVCEITWIHRNASPATHCNTRQHIATHRNTSIYRIRVREIQWLLCFASSCFKKQKKKLEPTTTQKATLSADLLHRRFRRQESIPKHSRRWLGKSRVWGRRVAARPSGNYPPTFRHKSHKSHVCFQQSAHIDAKEPCIPSRKSPLLPINNKPHGHVRFLYLQMYLSMDLCIYVSMRVCM